MNNKVQAILEAGMTPIMCCGETDAEREGGHAEEKVASQVRAGLAKVKPEQVAGLVIAYEPIWAIGTGDTATPEDAQDAIGRIRELLREERGGDFADGVRILYGGSVKPANVAEIMAQSDVDGALVGGASLKVADVLGMNDALR